MNQDNKFPTGFDLWQQVCTTNPRHTKKVSFGRKFTAIDAMYQLQEATRIWGSYGATWGVKNCKYEHLRDGDGKILELILEAEFYYPGGSFEISADCKYKVDNDCRKKILTDLTTKALSKLGFNADVFLGKYDDNKYISKVSQMFEKPENPASVKGAGVKRAKMSQEAFNKLITRIQKGEEGLIEKAVNNFDVSPRQLQALKQYATTE